MRLSQAVKGQKRQRTGHGIAIARGLQQAAFCGVAEQIT